MDKVKFTTWEKCQLAYIERMIGRELSTEEKCAIVWKLGWREQK